CIHYLMKHILGLIEEAKIVKRTAAAKWLVWNFHMKACFLQYLCGGSHRLWLDIIIKCIRPENDLLPAGITIKTVLHELLLECFFCKPGNGSLLCYSSHQLADIAYTRRVR